MADYSLLLVGRTGNGKSSTGNSILNKKVFTPVNGSAPANNDVKFDKSKIGGTSVTVVDGPGLGDGSFDNIEDVENAITSSKRSVAMLDKGFHLLLIIRYGDRRSQKEKDLIQWIKKIFGDSVIRNHGVVVVTHGDRFDVDMNDRNTTFDQWCEEQTGDVQQLFAECRHRRVLFNNKTSDDTVMKRQVEELFIEVRKIKSYTKKDFNEAEIERAELIAMANSAQLQKRTEELLEKIESQLDKVDDDHFKYLQKQLRLLRQMQNEIEQHVNCLKRKDQTSGALQFLLLQVSEKVKTIESKIVRFQGQIDQATTPIPQQYTSLSAYRPNSQNEQQNSASPGYGKFFLFGALCLIAGVVIGRVSHSRKRNS